MPWNSTIILVPDGNFIISSRFLSEITKIDRNTGDIIWRWGTASTTLTIVGPKNSTLVEMSFPEGIFSYRAIAFPPLPRTLTSGPAGTTPLLFALGQNYPNPFNPSTTIRYQLPTQGRVSLIVYDILGRQVATLVDSDQQAGAHLVQWNAEGQASGIYFCRIIAGNNTGTKKMLLVR